MLKNGREPPSSCRPTKTCTASAPMFSMVNEPVPSSSFSPRLVMRAAGGTVKITFGGAAVTGTLCTSEGGPVCVASQPAKLLM